MNIVKGSQAYIAYINEYITPDREIEDYITTIDEDVLVDMLDSGELLTYDEDYIYNHMKDNGYTLIIT